MRGIILVAVITVLLSFSPLGVEAQQYCADKSACNPSLKDPATGDTRTYDLSALCTADGTGYESKSKVSDLGHTWTVNVCGTVKQQCDNPQYCAYVNVTAKEAECAVNEEQKKTGMVVEWGWNEGCGPASLQVACNRCEIGALDPKASPGTWSFLYSNDPADGVQVMYPVVKMTDIEMDNAIDPCPVALGGRVSTYQFECSCDAVVPEFLGVWDTEPCNYTMKFRGREACYAGFCEKVPTFAPTVPPTPSGGSSGGLSGGSKFLFVTAAGVFAYLAVALFVNHRQRGELGIPETHKAAFGNFWGAAKEGMSFTLAKATGKGNFARRRGGSLASQESGGPSSYNASFQHEVKDGQLSAI